MRGAILKIISEVQGKTALIVDDFTISSGTLAPESFAATLLQRVSFIVSAGS
jgi:phosphoribosylpyrophosphate synthetase